MDDDKPSIIEEGKPDLPTEKPCLAGPMTLLVCIRFIILCDKKAMANGRLSADDLDDILEILSTNNAESDDEMDKLQEFAKANFLNLYICVINQNEKNFYYLNATSVEGNQQWPRAYLVFDKHNRSFYPFYTRDNNHKNHTVFLTSATHILNLFKQSVENYEWPIHPEIIRQTFEQNVPTLDQENISTSSGIFNKENVNDPSKNKIKASDVCNLFVQNVQNLMPQIGSQFDRLNYSFISSEYHLRDNELTSTKTICEALIRRLQMLMLFPDTATDHATKTNNIHPSMESDETTTVRSVSLNNSEQDAICSYQMPTKLSLRLNAQSTPFTNIDRSTDTTNNSNDSISLPKLELLNQPTRFRHNREVKTVGKGCPAVQVEGGRQRTPIQLRVPKEIRDHQRQFYIGTHVTTYDGKVHAQTYVAPKIKKAKGNQCLTSNDQEDSDEFDLKSNGVFSKINPNNLMKKLTVLMFNLKQDEDINKDLIAKDKLIWSRLMFAIYIKSSNGEYKRVSPPVYSDLIENTHGSQSLEFESVFPDQFCERGGQIIFIKLNESAEKCDLCVECNGRVLDQYDYQIAKTVLSFETPRCLPGRSSLHVTIDNKKTNNQIVIDRKYHQHDDHTEPCGVINGY